MSISKEIFGIEKIEITSEERTWSSGWQSGFNFCRDNIDQYELSEQELARVIQGDDFPIIIPLYRSMAQEIIKNQSKLFVRKNK